MTPLGKRLLPVLVCLLLLGVAFDYWRADRREVADRAALAETVPEIAELRATNRWLRGQLRLQQEPATATEPVAALPEPTGEVALGPVRDMIDLIQSGLLGKVSWPFIAMIGPDTTLDFQGQPPPTYKTHIEYLGRLLALSETQLAQFRQAAEDGLQEFTDAIAGDAQVSRDDNGRVVIALPDVSTAQAAYDRMLDSFASILGEERYGYFESIGARAAFDDAFQRFGLNGRTLTVWRGRAGSPERDMVLYRMDSGRGSSTGGVPNREGLRLNLGPLEALLPDDF